MNDLDKMVFIARKCRRILEKELKDNYPSDLAGACGLASYFLMREAERAGLYANYISGYFKGCNHSWVEFEDRIIDLTATQFGILKETYVVKKNNRKYQKEFQTSDVEEAYEAIRSWSFVPPKLYEERIYINV